MNLFTEKQSIQITDISIIAHLKEASLKIHMHEWEGVRVNFGNELIIKGFIKIL